MKNCKRFRSLHEALETQPQPLLNNSAFKQNTNSQVSKMNKNRLKITNEYDSVTDEEKDDIGMYDESDPINTIESIIS